MKILRSHYVSMTWMRASGPSPSDGLNPTDYGWFTNEHNRLQPVWFEGSASPGRLVRAADNIHAAGSAAEIDSDETIITDSDNDILDTDDDPWSEDSDSDLDCDIN